MQNGHRSIRLQATRFGRHEFHLHLQDRVHESRYRRVLVPTSLNLADRAALLLGFELASLHAATLTLLHVLRRSQRVRVADGLDAIVLLHAAAEELRATSPARIRREATPGNIQKFIQDILPPWLLDEVNWRAECRTGDVAETVVAFANESAADLVILPAKPLRWWLPVYPCGVSFIERRAQADVIVIRSQPPY